MQVYMLHRTRRAVLGAVAAFFALVVVLVATGTPAQAADYWGQLNSGRTMYSGDSLWSPSGQYRAVQQSDGNLVLMANPGNKPLWANGMGGRWGAELRMQATATP